MNRKYFRWGTYYLEHLIFPVVFMVFAAMMASAFMDSITRKQSFNWVEFSQSLRYIFLFFFNILIAYFLFMTKSGTKVYPDRYSEVLVPILATFWFFSYSLVEMVPYQYNPLMVPRELIEVMIPLGVLINLIGHGFSIAGVLSLRQSFGIVTKVNEVITTGLYGLVRHPIYFGYLIMTIGFMLMTPRVIHCGVYLLAILLQVWRAKIEENKLASSSEEYRRYMKNVPFLFPSLSRLCGLKK